MWDNFPHAYFAAGGRKARLSSTLRKISDLDNALHRNDEYAATSYCAICNCVAVVEARLIDTAINWRFARECNRAENLDDVGDLLLVEAYRLGFRFFALCSHGAQGRATGQPILVHNLPKAWQERYSRSKYADKDPILLRARRRTLPFSWSDPAFAATLSVEQRVILDEAAEHGLRHGATIPLHRPRRGFGVCSLISDKDPINHAVIPEAIAIAAYAYDALWRISSAAGEGSDVRLSGRERQCLELVALGKTDEEIAIILEIEPVTVHRHVERAKLRLGAMKRTQAVAYAVHVGAINLDDVFKH